MRLDPGFYGRWMTSIPTGAAWRPYLRVLAETGVDVVSVGAWVAVAELPPARRRLARGALAAINAAVAIPGLRGIRPAAVDTAVPATPGAGPGLPFVDVGIKLPVDPPSRRRAVLAGAAVLTTAVAASVGTAVAGRRLERRWLARLARQGHPHPHRALGVRMAVLYAVMVVPGRLLAVRHIAPVGSRTQARRAD
jgi:hypothetical protein